MGSRNEQAGVLVVDDEPGIRRTISAYLEAEGYAVETVSRGDEVLGAVEAFKPDVVVLDIMLPGMDGFQVLRLLRERSSAYVLMLSAKGEEVDRLVGLRMGADDYVTKPFSPREVVARVQALLRRSRGGREVGPGELRFQGLVIDPEARRATRQGEALSLTPIEFDLLLALARNRGRVLSREQLIRAAWGEDYFIEERVVDVHMRRLRQKVEPDPSTPALIVTVRGAGYRFEEKAE